MASSDGTGRLYQKQYKYNPTTDGTNVITLIDNQITLMNDKVNTPPDGWWVNGFIRVFRCRSVINSLPSVPMPAYADTDSPSDRLSKSKAVIWDSPAYRLILVMADKSNTWVELPFYNLTNSFGFPYVVTDLLKGLSQDLSRDIAEGCKLGIKFENIGWGLPKETDSLTFDLSWLAEYSWIKPYDVNISQPIVVQTATVQQVTQKTDSYTNTRVGTTAVQLMSANTSRLSGQITNNSANTIYYGLGITPTATSNSGVIAAGATVPLPAGNKTSVSVIANTGLQNSVTASETYNAS